MISSVLVGRNGVVWRTLTCTAVEGAFWAATHETRTHTRNNRTPMRAMVSVGEERERESVSHAKLHDTSSTMSIHEKTKTLIPQSSILSPQPSVQCSAVEYNAVLCLSLPEARREHGASPWELVGRMGCVKPESCVLASGVPEAAVLDASGVDSSLC